jgi:hypothetical protein
VAVYWDSRQAINGEEWDQGLVTGLQHSHVIFPLLSYGATAPMAFFTKDDPSFLSLWKDEEPLGLRRLEGVEEDREDGMLQVVLPPPLLILSPSRAEHSFTKPSSRGATNAVCCACVCFILYCMAAPSRCGRMPLGQTLGAVAQ